jgi:hypothetical protein
MFHVRRSSFALALIIIRGDVAFPTPNNQLVVLFSRTHDGGIDSLLSALTSFTRSAPYMSPLLSLRCSGSYLPPFLPLPFYITCYLTHLLSLTHSVCNVQEPYMCILEFEPYGDLKKVLTTCKEKDVKITTAEQVG